MYIVRHALMIDINFLQITLQSFCVDKYVEIRKLKYCPVTTKNILSLMDVMTTVKYKIGSNA